MIAGPYLSPARPRPGSSWRHAPRRTCERMTAIGIGETHLYELLTRRPFLRVLSSRIEAEFRGLICWQNHVSMVTVGLRRRPNDEEMAVLRADFDLVDAEEDNHSPGPHRSLFLPLHLPRGTTGICECKDDEEQVVEPDGFVWSRSRA